MGRVIGMKIAKKSFYGAKRSIVTVVVQSS